MILKRIVRKAINLPKTSSKSAKQIRRNYKKWTKSSKNLWKEKTFKRMKMSAETQLGSK